MIKMFTAYSDILDQDYDTRKSIQNSRDSKLIEFMNQWKVPFFPQEVGFFNNNKHIYVDITRVITALIMIFVNEETAETLTLQNGEFKTHESLAAASSFISGREVDEIITLKYY